MLGKNASIASVVFAALLAAAPNAAAEKGTEDPNLDLGQRQEVRSSWIFELSTSPGSAESAARSAVSGVGGRLKYVYTNGFVGFAASMPEPAVQQLLDNNPSVVSAARDVVITTAKPPGACDPWPSCKDDSGGSDDGGDTSTSDEVPWSTTRVGGPVNCADTSSTCAPVVYIMDTGIDDGHQDLNTDISGISARHFSCLGEKKYSNWQDQNGHGTHVAGTVGAKLNGVDTAGVAAGVTLASARILDENGNGLISDALCAMDEIIGQGVGGAVVNMSFMTAETADVSSFETAIVDGITTPGLFFAVAAGNNVISGPPFLRTNYTAEDLSPARVGDYESDGGVDPGIYTVSAIDSNDALADFSVSAAIFVSPAAPGVGVVSSKLGGGTTTKDGTSMAAPHVAGLLAACSSVDIESQGTATNDDVGTADPIAFCSDALTN